jgi:2-polyprenyl-6-methoxyphenol hydroxylase-like FAD-dependent oxidoreductase
LRIGVIGCGIAGMASAIALARNGHEVTVVERFSAARPVGAGLILQPSGLSVLDRLGALDEAEAWGARITVLDGRTVAGRRVLDLDYGKRHGLGIHRAGLFTVLHDRMLGEAVRLRLDFEVTGVAERHLIATSGEQDGPFDVILNCAGAHDRVRSTLPMATEAPLYPWGCFWCALPDKEGAWTGRLRQRYDGAHTMMGVLPIGRAPGADGHHVAWFWSLPIAEADAQRTAGLDRLKAKALACWPDLARLLEGLTSFDQLALATYRDVSMAPWRTDSVLVMGDAAHGTSPQLGQGANLALIDAITIAHCLRKKTNVPDALAVYERMRRPHVAYYQLTSRALTPAFQSHSTLMPWLRDTFLVAARHIPVGGYVTRTTLSGIRKFPFGLWRLPD